MKHIAQKNIVQKDDRSRKRILITQRRSIKKQRKNMGENKMDKDIDCNLNMEVDEKIECYFPGGKPNS
jgi:hypothetical protein